MSGDVPKAGPSGSLSDRISAPLNAASTSFTPGAAATPSTSKSWADEVASPVADGKCSLEKAQVDGSGPSGGGSALQDVEEFEVEVKLSDIQGDVNSPLYSAKSFDQLGL